MLSYILQVHNFKKKKRNQYDQHQQKKKMKEKEGEVPITEEDKIHQRQQQM